MTDFATILAQQAHVRADAPALSADGQSLTFSELLDAVLGQAGALLDAGLTPGQRIALLQDRTVGLCVDILACLVAGLPVTVLSRSEAPRSVSEKLSDAGFSHILADHANADAADALARSEKLSVLRKDALVARKFSGKAPSQHDEALLIFTSGSSGKPKAVRLSYGNIAANTRGLAALTPVGPDDHYLHLMPLSHTNGILNQLLYPLSQGARVTLLSRFTPEIAMKAVADLRPTVITGVPTMFQRLLDYPVPDGATENLRMLRCGSAALPVEIQDRIEAHWKCPVLVSYGQTEYTCTSTANPPGKAVRGSVGLALPGAEIAILSPGGDDILPAGQRGEVAFRGPSTALGYVGHPAFDPDGWVRSGDIGYLDDDGYLFLTGRLKEVIIRGGENLAPVQIEDVLLTCTGIEAACVVPAPHADLGEVPFAFVEQSGQIAPLDDLNARITDILGRSHCISGIEVLERLPENHVGKIDRRSLKAEMSRRANVES